MDPYDTVGSVSKSRKSGFKGFNPKRKCGERREVNQSANFIKSNRGNPILVDEEGHHYVKDRSNPKLETIFWRCRHKANKGAGTTDEKCYVYVTTRYAQFGCNL